MEWSIQDVARLTGTTSRTLRHYDDIELLPPTSVGRNGYRYYDENALARLQRVLLLRDLGLGLSAIADVLEGQKSNAEALTGHLEWLRREKDRLDRQIASVQSTIRKMEEGEQLMAGEMFDGFDHTRYQREVEERWGKNAYASGDTWWRALTTEQKEQFTQNQLSIAADFAAAHETGLAVDSTEVQAIAKRQYDWIAIGWQGLSPTAEQFVGLGDMYVADDRFGANYGGRVGAQFVRDAMAVYAERAL